MAELVAKDELIDFLRIIRRATFRDFAAPPLDDETFRSARVALDKFLYRLCVRESSDLEVAACIAELVRREFYKKAFSVADDDAFESRVRSALWGGASPRFWLFKTVRETAQDLVQNLSEARRKAARLGVADLWKGAPLPKGGAPVKSAEACELKEQRFAAVFRMKGFCERECDLMFFLEQGFSKTEIAEALKLKPSTAWRYLTQCEENTLNETVRTVQADTNP
jgi:DNA-directed RNA polymerase specialized sigma24 family protein